MKKEKLKKHDNLTDQEFESLELLQRSKEKQGRQLVIDAESSDIKEIDELRQMIGKTFESPDEKYQLYYKGIRNILIKHLPKGKENKPGRDLIYDEKNIFLTEGKKKSDNDGVRGGDSRMTFQSKMNEMLDIIMKWVSESQNPMDLYDALYDLNEKHGYGHENYDETSVSYNKAVKASKKA